jgi:hypothetical protein
VETTFHNVTITIEADSPEEAYELLCKSLGQLGDGFVKCCEWQTDTYSTDEDADAVNDCAQLYPGAGDDEPSNPCEEHIHVADPNCPECRGETKLDRLELLGSLDDGGKR